MTLGDAPYRIERHRRVQKFLARHPDLSQIWPGIESALGQDPHPRQGDEIVAHLKADLLCNYRWREGSYRFLYEIDEETRTILVYDADSRGHIYRRR